MLRRRRHHLDEKVFEGTPRVVFLTICTASRHPWLAKPSLASVVRDEIKVLHETHPVLGFCLMPDHLHLLFGTAGDRLPSVVGRFKGRASRKVRQLEPELEVWQPGYWDHVIRRDDGLLKTLQYLLLNPVRAGLADEWWTYPWLGSPLLGPVRADFFDGVTPETVVWRDVLQSRG